ncbi:AAA family ATPase [Duganella sp. FT3S]|uniref:AAA family ATPase n=2 Tax=Rugamonas fusca TaxID=2758568 RepID=A0A7W2EGA1_9BURK|nr:AAA family ATPase [Rugamonas fusca]
MFRVFLHDESGVLHDIGQIKIGFKGQTIETDTYQKLSETFSHLEGDFFSLGQSVDYYKSLAALPDSLKNSYLSGLNDMVAKPELIETFKDEKVFKTSLLREVSLSVIKGQFPRVLNHKPELTDFKFKFIRPEEENFGAINLPFTVKVDSTPSTNIHAIIGRNGVGKTTILNGMINAITDKQSLNKFIDRDAWDDEEISDDYFSSLVSVSFSAFDPFHPPKEQPDPSKGTCYFYIGLKDQLNEYRHRTIIDLQSDCTNSLINCFYKKDKKDRWLNAIEKLGSDENFALMNLAQLESIYQEIRKNISHDEQSDSKPFQERYLAAVAPFLSRMSSGHAIVLLTITRLVATVEEKTLVLLDEPESHLHPPLLSAFIRALADLLHDRNGVAIIATHSPVVLQEIPKSCVWKIYRVGKSITTTPPSIETFGENLGLLTSEVFSLEVERSGFHDILAKSVESGKTYEEIISDYKDQLGFEGKAILKALVVNRDRSRKNDAIG